MSGDKENEVDADVMSLLREYSLEDLAGLLATKGVQKMQDLQCMTDADRENFGCRLGFRVLLNHLAQQKKKQGKEKTKDKQSAAKKNKAAQTTKQKGKKTAEKQKQASPPAPDAGPSNASTTPTACDILPRGQRFLRPAADEITEWRAHLEQGDEHIKGITVLDDVELASLKELLQGYLSMCDLC